jgi:hypothetical protein
VTPGQAREALFCGCSGNRDPGPVLPANADVAPSDSHENALTRRSSNQPAARPAARTAATPGPLK